MAQPEALAAGGRCGTAGLSSLQRRLCCGLRCVLARLCIYRTNCTELFLLQSFKCLRWRIYLVFPEVLCFLAV